jgi:serine/threonine protein kinase
MQESPGRHKGSGLTPRHIRGVFDNAEIHVPEEWKVGDTILDTYEVKYVHTTGGMGLVYRVHHRGWNVDLAVKSPRITHFLTEQHQQNFVRECETWIDLGLHPHIVSCHYVRKLGGIPRVFAEYVEGGSLRDWIQLQTLYVGGPKEALRRILDIAIQMSWGLHYAHEREVVHQDVKPGNILMTPDGTAKVSDFGLARAQAAVGEAIPAHRPDVSLMVPGGGGRTKPYASPEQFKGDPLTRRTDIWSWAVMMYEMFAGELTWELGVVVPELLENYLKEGTVDKRIPRMPSRLADLLRQCLRFNPNERPHDFAVVVEALKALYQDVFRAPLQRAVPERRELDADSISNRIVSLVDLNRVFNPLHTNPTGASSMPDALSLMSDLRAKKPDHHFGRINDSLIHWREMCLPITDLDRQMDNIYSSPFMPDLLDWQITLELEKCDFLRARRLLDQSKRESCQALMGEVYQRHEYVRSCLFDYFQCRVSIPKMWARYLVPSEEEYPHWDFAMANPQSGIAVRRTDKGRIVVENLFRNISLCEIAFPSSFPAIALSENGKLLACAFIGTKNDKEYGLREYTVSVYSTNDGSMIGTYSGITDDTSIRAITIDDCCKHLSIWLDHRGKGYYELVLDIDHGELKPYHCDFRKESEIRNFSRVFINGEGTLLLAVSGSRCSLWRFPSADKHGGFNVLDIDLADFGLVNSHGQLRLPKFEPDKGFEFEVNDWNAHDLMRLLNTMPTTRFAEYLICRPQNSESYFLKQNAKKNLLRSADEAEKKGDWTQALYSLTRYCETSGAYEESIMYRRHRAALSHGNVRVERCWHHDSHNQYWMPNAFGLSPGGNELVIIHWWRELEEYPLSRIVTREIGVRWIEKCPEKELSIGIHKTSSNHILIYTADRNSFLGRVPSKGHLALFKNEATIEPPVFIWYNIFQKAHLLEEALNKIAYAGETVLAEFESGVITALDIQTGHCVGSFDFSGDIDLLKTVRDISGKKQVFACSPSRGVYLDGHAMLCKEIRWIGPVSRHLQSIVAVADDLSSLVCRYRSGRLAHLRLSDQHLTEVWNWYEDGRNSIYYCEPEHIVISPCGRAVAYVQRGTLFIFDVASRHTVFRWEPPWNKINGLSFDGSGRWLMLAHSENQLEIFQFIWNAPELMEAGRKT